MPAPNRTFSRQSGHFGEGRGETRQNALPTPKVIEYFEDAGKQKINPAWVDREAQEWAQSFKGLKATQMRRFYDDLKAIERKVLLGKDLQARQSNFERDRALLMMFKAKAAYAEKRQVSPRAFTQFIFDHMESIKDLKDFQAFIKIFEAVVAFHRFFAEEK